MTGRHPLWHHRPGRLLGHLLFSPLQKLLNRVPHWGYGLARPELTRLVCHHPPLRGRRAVQLTDLHVDRYTARHDYVAHAVADLRPDWIFVTGDLLNLPDGLPHLFRFLGRLRQTAPVFITLGNHDHFSGVPIERFQDLASQQDVTLLVNETALVRIGHGELAVIGVDDPSLGLARLPEIGARTDRRFTLLLAHAPNITDTLQPHHAIDLVLCGHSHGGQWRLPCLPPFWLPPGCQGRASGLYDVGCHRLYVNRGLGWSVLPVRWNCPPEILVLEWVDRVGLSRQAA